MENLKILGISGSPRKANTDLLLDLALQSAEEQTAIQIEKIYLRKKNIKFCTGCFKCFDENENEYACQVWRDSMDEIYPKLQECHGLIIATPVYFGGVSAQTKAFMDRTEPLLRYTQSKWKSALKNKVGAVITVGGNRNGGQETTIQSVHHFFMIHDMIIVGNSAPSSPGCYLGAAATTYPQRGRAKKAAKDDELGTKASKMIGLRVAEFVKLLWHRS